MPRAADPTPEEPITRAVLMDARLRQAKDTGRVEVREIRILPGHAGVIYQPEGQPAALLQAGDVFYEPEGVRIARFDAGDQGATFIAYFLLSLGQQAEIRYTGR
jgi:hypothetical protein